MILKSLYDFAIAHADELPPLGMEYRKIAYIIVIDNEGRFVRIEKSDDDTLYKVVKSVIRSSNTLPNALWDNAKYVLGLGKDKKNFNSFVKLVDKVSKNSRFKELPATAVLKFYHSSGELQRVLEEIKDGGYKVDESTYLTFQVEGYDSTVAEILSDKVSSIIDSNDKSDPFADLDFYPMSDTDGICLVTGKRRKIVRVTTPIPALNGSSLVSFQEGKGFDSYGKKQAYNAPISTDVEDRYVASLKYMTSSKSDHSYKLSSNSKVLFWSAGSVAREIEADNFLRITFGLKIDELQPTNTEGKVLKLFRSIYNDKKRVESDDRFYMLGLRYPSSSGGGRTVVTMYAEIPLKEFAGIIAQHFEDMDLCPRNESDDETPYRGIRHMLSAVALDGNSESVPPHLKQQVVAAVLNGSLYPYSLYTSALDRLRADLYRRPLSGYDRARIAILKAYLNRKYRNHFTHNSRLNNMLDTNNTNPGYLCGRLAAVLVKIQEDAKSGDTIRTRYMGAASATPATVFPAMLNLSLHHIEKIENEGFKIKWEKLKQEIVNLLPAEGFPKHLSLEDQGRFYVGYYHQIKSIYTSKGEQKQEENN